MAVGKATSEFDTQRNSIIYGSICVCIAICGALIGIGFAYGIDGGCVTDSFFQGKTPEACITKKSAVTDKSCPKGFWGRDCLPCLDCNGHGVCYGSGTADKFAAPGDGTCLCNKGFTGVQCEQCLPGYYGPTCQPCDDCPDDRGVCKGTGSVSSGSNGACGCYYPFSGSQCITCVPGMYGSSCNVRCDGTNCVNGQCSSQGACLCNAGYKGSTCATCDTQNGVYYVDSSSQKCMLNYTLYCIQNQSVTAVNQSNHMHYYGKACQKCNDVSCSGHGKCSSGLSGGGHCVCDDNWGGAGCEKNLTAVPGNSIRCSAFDSTLCDGRGLCYQSQQTGDKLCICNTGYAGANCTQCDDGYEPFLNSNTQSCKSVCSVTDGVAPCNGHGTCDAATATCSCTANTSSTEGFYAGQFCGACQDGAFGATCQKCPNCGNGKCKGSGTNTGDGSCSCFAGYDGPSCDRCAYGYQMDTSVDKCRKCPVDAVTQKVCNAPNGVCTISNAGQSSTASCTCENGFSGKTCGKKSETASTKSCLKDCYGNGKCSNGICFCSSGYSGAYCNLTAPAKCTASSCGQCETCNAISGLCELIDRCCGNGEYFSDQCFCRRGYAGEDCSSVMSTAQQAVKQYKWKWMEGTYVVNTNGQICSKMCGNGLKERKINCVEYTNEKGSDSFTQVPDSKCTDAKPDSFVACNNFPCKSTGTSVDLRVVKLTFDMDYTTVMNDAIRSKTFEESLVADFNALTNNITSNDNIEVVALKKGSVKAYVILHTPDNEKVIQSLDSVAGDENTAAAASLDPNKLQVLKILTKATNVVKSEKLEQEEISMYVLADSGNSKAGSQVADAITDSSDRRVTPGGQAAISIIIVFVFVGLLVGIGGFVRAKRDWIKQMATQSTASRPQQVNIKLTAEEHNNPLMLQMSGDKAAKSNIGDKKGSALASAVATVQRAIQLDNEHNWAEAAKWYKKANDQFAVVLENETNANTRFALAKKVNGYLEREHFLAKKVSSGGLP